MTPNLLPEDGTFAVQLHYATLAAPPNEPTVMAELLHPYASFGLPFDQWLRQLLRMCQSARPQQVEYHGVKMVDDTVALSMIFARSLANLDPTMAGAIPEIAIEEFYLAGEGAPKDMVNTTLRQFVGLVGPATLSPSRLLHQYLEVEEDFGPWLAGYIKKLKMERGRNYLKWHDPTEGETIILTFRMAQEIAQLEKSRRGMQVKAYMDGHKQRKLKRESFI